MRLFGISIAIIAAIVLLSLAFAGPRGNEGPTIDYGPRALTGVLLRAPVSLTRRGTHLLVENGTPAMYVESTSINLASLEAQTVYVEGNLEPNTLESDLPVLIVHSAQPAFTVFAVKKWTIAALSLSLDAPAHWQGNVQGDSARFRVGEIEAPMLTIKRLSGSSLPPGSPFFVQGKRAVRTGEGTAKDVYIQDDERIIHLHFDAAIQASVSRPEDAILLVSQFEKLLKSIAFAGSVQSTGATGSAGSESAGGICGGAAKLLCPTGSYCLVTDPATGEGICRSR